MTNAPPASRVSAWEWAQTALLAANLAWTTLCLGGYRAETQVATALLTCALVVVHLVERAVLPHAVPPLHPAGWWLLPFLLYATANLFWVTPVRWLGWFDWMRWAGLIAVFWVGLNGIRSHRAQRVVFFTLVIVAIVGVVLACYQRFLRPDWIMLAGVHPSGLGGRASGSFGIPNSFAGFLLLILPAAGALAFRRSASATQRVWWGWVTVVLAFGLVLTISRGAWVALSVALAVTPLIAVRGSWWRRARIAALLLLVVAVVGGALFVQSPKFRARFVTLVLDAGEKTRPQIWRGAWHLFRDSPWLGTGAGSFNVVFERHRPERFRDEPLWAHNEYLNTLSDYGAVGFLLFFGACGLVAMRAIFRPPEAESRRRDWLDSPTVLAALGAGLLAFALQAMLDFHLKIPALALACATVAALAVGRVGWVAAASDVSQHGGTLERFANSSTSEKLTFSTADVFPPARIASLVVASACAWVTLALIVPRLRAEALRQQARREIDRTALQTDLVDSRRRIALARELLPRAVEADASNGQAWADLSYAAALWIRFAPAEMEALGREAERGAERALACSRVCSEFWIRRGVARDVQGRWLEAGEDFQRGVELAPADAYAWYYYADHLFRVKWAREVAEAALRQCLRLDPENPSGVALRQRLAINPSVH